MDFAQDNDNRELYEGLEWAIRHQKYPARGYEKYIWYANEEPDNYWQQVKHSGKNCRIPEIFSPHRYRLDFDSMKQAYEFIGKTKIKILERYL